MIVFFYISGFIAGFITVRLLVNYQQEGIWSIKITNHKDEE